MMGGRQVAFARDSVAKARAHRELAAGFVAEAPPNREHHEGLLEVAGHVRRERREGRHVLPLRASRARGGRGCSVGKLRGVGSWKLLRRSSGEPASVNLAQLRPMP